MTFLQFAFNNIRRGARTYAAFFLSSVFMVMIFFSYSVFMFHPGVAAVEMGESTAAGMKIASYIVFIFAFFFVMYSISAFLKLRNLEFGLLTILGARPGQINRLILLENMLIGLLSIVSGLAAGLLLSKLFLLLGTAAIGLDALPFYWPVRALITTSAAFVVLFLANSIFTLLLIRRNQVLELLKGSVKPKQEPKASWLLCMLGLTLLGTGALAMYGRLSPRSLLGAAVTGIAGTYFFYSQLSVLGLRMLKNNRKRSWRGTNLIWISEMGYKLKDNARILFLVTTVTSLACMAAAILLSLNHADRENYENNPFAFNYTVYPAASSTDISAELQEIRNRLSMESIDYSEHKVDFIRSSIIDEKKNRAKGVLLMPFSSFHELAEMTGDKELPPLTVNEAVLFLNPRYTDYNYEAGQSAVLTETIGQGALTLKQIRKPKIMPFGRFTNPVLIVEDGFYKQAAGGAGSNSLIENYYYTVPSWNDSPPSSIDDAKFIISSEVVKGNRIRNHSAGTYNTMLEARAFDYFHSKQENSMFGFIGIFIALVFSLSSASFLYFKLHTELNTDMKMYHSLSKIGLSIREMSSAATRQIALLFYVPVLVAAVQTLVVVRPVLYLFHIRDSTLPILVTVAAFLAVQSFYFIIIRALYVKSLKKMMV